MALTPQAPETSQVYAIYGTAYEGFWELIDWVMKGHAERAARGHPHREPGGPTVVGGRHGVFRVLEIGPGRSPCPYLTRLLNQYRPIHLTCVEQEADAFQHPEWQTWIKAREEQGIVTTVGPTGACHVDAEDGRDSRVLLCPETDIFCHTSRYPYDLVLLHSVIHEIHKGPQGREHWITEAPLPYGHSPEMFFSWPVANRLLNELDQNPLDNHREDLLERLHPEQQSGKIRFRGLLFRRHLQALQAAVIEKGADATKVMAGLRVNAAQKRLQMIRDLFDHLLSILDHEGDLLLGEWYFPAWMPMSNRVKNVREAREKLHDVHRDDADFFLDPGLILSCALTPLGRNYARERAWSLYHDNGPTTQPWMKGGFRELLEPERQGIGCRDGRRYYVCRLRPSGVRVSEKNVLEDCLSAGRATAARLNALRDGLNDSVASVEDQLQLHLFDDPRLEQNGVWIGKPIFRYMIDELSKRIAKWRRAEGRDPCEVVEYWFSYESSMPNVQRMSFLPRADEIPADGEWQVRGGAGRRVVWDGTKYVEDSRAWSTICWNAWLASRKLARSPEGLEPQALHRWFMNESPQVSDPMARLFRIADDGSGCVNGEQGCPIRSITYYPSFEWIKEKHAYTPCETVVGEIAACKAAGDPDHLYFEMDARDDNASPGWRDRICDWTRRFGEILTGANDFVPRVKVRNPPFEEGHPFERLFSAFVATVFGIPPNDWAEACTRGLAVSPVCAGAYKSIPAWLEKHFAAFADRRGADHAAPPFPAFVTILPISLPSANYNVGSLVLFTSRPLSGALLNMLALVSSRIVAQVRQIEQDVQLVEKAAAEERLKQQAKARAELEGTLEDLRVARARAETAARARDFFLAQVSHELRTPLNHVLGFSQLLESTTLDESQQRDLRKIYGAGKYLESLIDDILDYQKIIMGQIPINLEEFEAAPWIQEVAAAMEPKIRDKGNQLWVDCAPDLGNTLSDRKRLRQVLNNLLGNAAKFTTKGAITVTAQREFEASVNWLVVAVADTGKGISAEMLPKLFRPFSVGDRQDNPEGTGLGLAICKILCEKMGGEIWVASEVGKGSTFTFRLPMAGLPADGRVAAPRSGMRKSGPLPSLPDRPCTVLVIDDDPKVAELMKRFLEAEGFAIQVAGSGVAGLELVKTVRPDVITLDLKLPGIDGWGVLAALKNDSEVRDIPVVIVSIVDDSNRGLLLGADDYVTKPVDWERLVRLLRKYRSEAGGDILVVDDDREWRDGCRRLLEQHGWNVTVAEDGTGVLDRLAEQRPTLILLDLRLSAMDGFDVLGTVRRNPAWKDIPIIVMTGTDLTPDERRRLNGAVQGILAKGQRGLEELLADVVREVKRYRRQPQPAIAHY